MLYFFNLFAGVEGITTNGVPVTGKAEYELYKVLYVRVEYLRKKSKVQQKHNRVII
jgi:hypothetical protein